jgi:hypothetical protein
LADAAARRSRGTDGVAEPMDTTSGRATGPAFARRARPVRECMLNPQSSDSNGRKGDPVRAVVLASAFMLLVALGVATAQAQDGSIVASGINNCGQRDAVPEPEYCTVTPIYGGPSPATEAVLIAPAEYSGAYYTVTVRTASNAPMPGVVVKFIFGSQVDLCGSPVPNQIQAMTGMNGVANLYLRGGGCLTNIGDACRVTANDIEIRTIRGVRSMDNADHQTSQPDLAVDPVA